MRFGMRAFSTVGLRAALGRLATTTLHHGTDGWVGVATTVALTVAKL